MWWPEKCGGATDDARRNGSAMPGRTAARLLRVVTALGFAALSGGCFQPLYGEKALRLKSGKVALAASPKGVKVVEL